MSYSISASGHIDDVDTETAAQIEAELAVAIHDVLSQPKYGCTSATLYGQYSGTVNLLAAPAGDDSDEPKVNSDADPDARSDDSNIA